MYGRVTEEEVPRARQCCSDACVLDYLSMSEEINIKGRRIKVILGTWIPEYEVTISLRNVGNQARKDSVTFRKTIISYEISQC